MDIIVKDLNEYIKLILKYNPDIHSFIEDVIRNYKGDNIPELDSEEKKKYSEYIMNVVQDRVSLSYKDVYGRPNGRFYYRGQYDSSFSLKPSVYRGDNYKNENFFFNEIKVRCAERFTGLGTLDSLVTMQHYDCPTRLLDITSNPLVALYFACKNYGCSACDKTNTGKVFVFYTDRKHIYYCDSDKAIMLANISKLEYEDKIRLNELALSNLNDKKFVLNGDGYHDWILEKYYQSIIKEHPYFKRRIVPFDLLRPIIVQPQRTNSRILKQDGAFILPGLSMNVDNAVWKIENQVAMEIIVSEREHILSQLDSIGINEASLFPELDKVSNYLKSQIL